MVILLSGVAAVGNLRQIYSAKPISIKSLIAGSQESTSGCVFPVEAAWRPLLLYVRTIKKSWILNAFGLPFRKLM